MTTAGRRRGQLRRYATPERAARRLEVLRRWRSGERSSAIARALGVSRRTVIDDMQRIAPDVLAEHRHKLAGEAEHRRKRDTAIRRARGQGHTLKAIAAAAGVTYQRIQALTRVAPLVDVTDARAPGKLGDAPLDRPERPCANCGRPFQPTARRRLLCSTCFARGGDADDDSG